MTQDEIIEMANQAGIVNPQMVINTLEDFAKLVAQHEREACAKIAETPISGEQDDITMEAKDRVAKAIRARSNT